jgi:omega-6 fatty acid desaturase (delta-12 desaturase)
MFTSTPPSTSKHAVWKSLVVKYHTPHPRKSIWQFANTVIPFFLLWYLMYLTLEVSYGFTLLLAFPTAGFLIRLFIIQHDCGHGSFFHSRKVNDWVGLWCSLFTWTPYYYWQKGHAIHHAHAGNLQQRGIGDIHTLTVKEYLQRSRWGKLKYRLYRHPLILFLVVPTLLFVVLYRFPTSRAPAMKRVQSSVYWTNLVVGVFVGGMMWLVGWKGFVFVHAPLIILAASAGTWVFFVQHQFEETYWASHERWDCTVAALQGSSYYKLPTILRWFTGNIGFHHIHHLSPRIPNYLLGKCHEENRMLQETTVLTLRTSLKSICLSLWDEDQQRLVSFQQLKQRQAEMHENS